MKKIIIQLVLLCLTGCSGENSQTKSLEVKGPEWTNYTSTYKPCTKKVTIPALDGHADTTSCTEYGPPTQHTSGCDLGYGSIIMGSAPYQACCPTGTKSCYIETDGTGGHCNLYEPAAEGKPSC